MSAPRILDWKPIRRNSLVGFAKIELPSGMILIDVAIHASSGSAWASPPARPMVDRTGQVMKDASGKNRYVPLIEFASKEVRDKFSHAVVDALRAARPEAFADARLHRP